jgi:hypothetical protein
VSRLREKTSYQLVHVFWRFEGNIDALIWLGAHRADRAGQLVRVWDGEQEKEKLLQAARKRGLPQLSG